MLRLELGRVNYDKPTTDQPTNQPTDRPTDHQLTEIKVHMEVTLPITEIGKTGMNGIVRSMMGEEKYCGKKLWLKVGQSQTVGGANG